MNLNVLFRLGVGVPMLAIGLGMIFLGRLGVYDSYITLEVWERFWGVVIIILGAKLIDPVLPPASECDR